MCVNDKFRYQKRCVGYVIGRITFAREKVTCCDREEVTHLERKEVTRCEKEEIKHCEREL